MAIVTRLAEEVLAMILAPSLTVPYNLLTSRYVRAFGGNDLVPSSSVLLVCKRWMRVATPLLYETVVIRSTGQSYALAEALQTNPTFARYIKNVRLEGAYGGLYDILKGCHNLSTLVLFLNIYSDARITCLTRMFPAISPKHVFLFDSGGLDNLKFRKVFKAFCDAIPTWKTLVTFGYPYSNLAGNTRVKPDNRTRREILTDALLLSSSLRLVYCDEAEDYVEVRSLQLLARMPSVTIRILCDSQDNQPYHKNYKVRLLNDPLSKIPLPASSFEFISRTDTVYSRLPTAPSPLCIDPFKYTYTHSLGYLAKRPQKSPSSGPSISFSRNTISQVPDILWAEIFLLATTPLRDYDAQECVAFRETLRLVSNRFSNVISYLSCTHPLLNSHTMVRNFTNDVIRAPYLGNFVVQLSLYSPSEISPACAIPDLCALFPLLTSLRHLRISRSYHNTLLLPSHALVVLARAAGETLRSIKADFVDEAPILPGVLALFTNLAHVDMGHPCPFLTATAGLAANALESLEEIHLTGGSSFLDTLTLLRPPRLRIVVFSTSNPPIEDFIGACGASIEELHFTGITNFSMLFRHTPRLRRMRWGPALKKQRQYQDTIVQCFKEFGPHPTLQMLRLTDLPGHRCDTERSKVFKLIFDHLNLKNFVSLRVLQFEEYCWPDDERSIQRDILPGIATNVKHDYGIDITDSSGKAWRPRVQKVRAGPAHVRGGG